MVSKVRQLKNYKGVSPVIGVILLVALVVALIALASVIVFNIGTESSDQSADASIDFSQTSSGVSVQVISNDNVEEFKILGPNDFEETLSGNVGSSANLIGEEGEYSVIAVLPNGEEQLLLSETVEDLDYSGVFVVIQDEEEEEVEAELRQQFDNVDEYSLSLLTEEEDSEDELVQATHTYDEQLLSQQLVNDNPNEQASERLELLSILTQERFADLTEPQNNTFQVGERIAIHEMTNLCPGDELALENDESGDVLSSETIRVDTGCSDLRTVTIYNDGKVKATQLINLWNQEQDYFVFNQEASFDPELPTQITPIDEEEGTEVIVNVTDEDTGDELEGATVHVGDLIETTNSTGTAVFENVSPNEEIEAVAYKDGYQPSEVTDIEIISPENNPQYEDLELKLEPVEFTEPTIEEGNIGDEPIEVPTTGGGGVVVGSFGGGGGGATGGGGGGFIGGGGFYGAGGASVGATTTTLSSSAPSSPSEPVTEIQEPQRVFNVQDIDESLIPENEEFRVDTTATATGEENLEDSVVVYKSERGSDNFEEIGNESVILPGGDDTITNSQELSIGEEGTYRIFVSLNSTDEYISAGVLDVFPEDRLDSSIDAENVDVTLETSEGDVREDGERARVGDEITISVDGDSISTTSATVDIFKNGNRVSSGLINSSVSHTETFESTQYAQYHIGIQESQDVSLLDTIVVTEEVESPLFSDYDVTADIDEDNSECLDDDIGTSGQFDCQVDISEDSTVTFDASGSTIEVNEEEVENSEINYEWRFGEESVESVEDENEEVSHEFETDTVHLVEFIVDAEVDGESFSDRTSFIVNAVEDPNTIDTRITNTDVTEDNDVTIDIRNDRQTIDEDVKIEFINESSGEVVNKYDQEVTARADSTIEYRESLDPADFGNEEEFEGGDIVEFRVELTTEDESTTFRDESSIVDELTIPDASIDATIDGSVEVCEEDCE